MEPVTLVEIATSLDVQLAELQNARAARDAAVARIAAAEVAIQKLSDQIDAAKALIVKASPSVLPKQ